MNRRAFLGAAVTATAAGLGGCLGTGGAGDDGAPNASDDAGTGDQAPADGTECTPLDAGEGPGDADAVAGALADVAARLQAMAEPFIGPNEDRSDYAEFGRTRSLDAVEETRDRLSAARCSLDVATADGDSTARLAALRDVAEFQALLLESHALALEAIGHYHTANRYEHGDLDIGVLHEENIRMDPVIPDGNADKLTEVDPVLQEMTALRGEIHDAHETLDTTALETPALSYDGDPRQYYKYTRTEIALVQKLIRFSREGSYRGIAELLRGIEDLEAERWSTALEQFETAHEKMVTARTAFVEILENDAYSTIARDPREFGLARHSRDRIGNFADATATLIEAAEAFAAGDESAGQSLFETAKATLEDLYYPGVIG